MPSKPLKPCAYVGCSELTNKTYCAEHQAAKDKEQRSRARRSDKSRKSRSARGYDSKWYQYRKAYLAKNPWCIKCAADRKHTPATQVDHIIPHKGNKKLFWDTKNHQGLCGSCHSRKTAREDGGFGRSPRTKKVSRSALEP